VLVAASAGACAEERPRPDGLPTGRIHPPGILEPASDAFHGRELARRGWDLALCAKCHGEDFAGGAARVSCRECHADGPDACATCHRADTETAAHRAHREAGVGCAVTKTKRLKTRCSIISKGCNTNGLHRKEIMSHDKNILVTC
jgi:hypothetical protein